MEPPRQDRILDQFLTNRPDIVENMHTLSGISDYDIPIVDCDQRQNILEWNHQSKYTILQEVYWGENETDNFRDQFIEQDKAGL